MDNYKVIEQKLRKLEPFNGNSMSAKYVGFDYYVFSYITPIARRSGENPSNFYVVPEKYSVTTSRHQNLVRKAWGLN